MIKYRGIPHLIECMYLNDHITSFHVNEVHDIRSKVIYINDPMYLSNVEKYISLGMEIISRFKHPDVNYIPYDEYKDLKIVHWSNVFRSDLPIFLCNYNHMKVSYVDDTLAVHTPNYIGNTTYKGDLTFLGLIKNNLKLCC